ncbi:MAG: alanine dehydrogenase [Phycisphaerae bacterium]|nr:alanine dehydrogenase [Phycisphaerae bacterium]
MIVGVVKEVKAHEYRVGMTPSGVAELVRAGNDVLVEADGGTGSGFADSEYVEAGAKIIDNAADIFASAEMIVKVKEPQPAECKMLRKGQVCFTYFHFAADRVLTEGVLKSGCIAIAYETVRDRRGRLPLLTPMSEVAGRMAVQEGAKYLERPMMGRGILLGGVPGVEPAHVVILGGGVVGTNAAKLAAGLGAHVVLMDIDLDRLRYLSDVMPANVQTLFSDATKIREQLAQADLVIGAVLIPGARCPVLISRSDLALMKPGAVIVDVGVDQGGCCETIKPTTHDHPTYIVDGVVHYGVANMPGAVGRTSTFALTNATMPYALRLADMGYRKATKADPGLAEGVDAYEGYVANKDVAKTFGMEYRPYQP